MVIINVRFIRHMLGVFSSLLLFCLQCNRSEPKSELVQSLKQNNVSANESYQAAKTRKEKLGSVAKGREVPEVPQDSEKRGKLTKEDHIKETKKIILACTALQKQTKETCAASEKQTKETRAASEKKTKETRATSADIPKYVYIENLDREKSGFFSIFRIFGLDTTNTLSTVDTSFGNFSNDDDSLLSVSGGEENSIKSPQELNNQEHSWWNMSWPYFPK